MTSNTHTKQNKKKMISLFIYLFLWLRKCFSARAHTLVRNLFRLSFLALRYFACIYCFLCCVIFKIQTLFNGIFLWHVAHAFLHFLRIRVRTFHLHFFFFFSKVCRPYDRCADYPCLLFLINNSNNNRCKNNFSHSSDDNDDGENSAKKWQRFLFALHLFWR